MKKILSLFLAICLAPIAARAAGIFVGPKSAEENHQDMNQPAQRAIIVYGAGQEELVLQVKYSGPVDDFGWLIPVPNLPAVREGSMKCFDELSRYTQQPQFRIGAGRMLINPDYSAQPPVDVVETNTIGAYETAVLSARDPSALKQWLADNHFYLPPGKADALDSYITQHWYFVAVKVSLDHSASVTGELNPLQICFASELCLLPLDISPTGGDPSTVQAYVLSQEPLIEAEMLEKELPATYAMDSARAQAQAAQYEKLRLYERNNSRRRDGVTVLDNSPLPAEDLKGIQGISKTLMPLPDELVPYAKVTKTDLPECSAAFPRFADHALWLMKKTWTLQSADMPDLVFEPAFPIFTELLGTRYGYFGDASLTSFGVDGIPSILAAMQSTNPTVRTTTAAIFHSNWGGYIYGAWQPDTMRDPRIAEAAPGWLKDSEPEVRMAGIMTVIANWDTKFAEPLIGMLRDKDADVRSCATGMIMSYSAGAQQFTRDMQSHAPELEQMLKDKEPAVRGAALQVLQRWQVQIPRDELVSFFHSSDYRVLDAAWAQLQGQGDVLSDADTLVLLNNPEPVGRLLGLNTLVHEPSKQSIELALPLLQDPNESVRLQATQTLQVMTGQNFPADRADEWIKWWDENKAGFVPPPQSEEYSLPNGDAYQARGCKFYDVHKFARALADFRNSCKFGAQALDYSWFRIWLIEARTGNEPAATKELLVYLKSRQPQNPPDWPLQIGRFLTGQISEADLLKDAANDIPQTDREQHCEAYFYAGSRRLIDNDRDGAADLFKKCLATGVTNFEEYDSAAAELKGMN